MKKLMIALAVIASMNLASAQTKGTGAAAKAVEAAEAAAQNAKKATKSATWLKLGQAYMDAYNAPSGNIWLGASKQDLNLVMAGEKPISTETVTVGGAEMTKEVYSDKDLYFQNDQLAIINVTKPVVENALDKALDAYTKAYELDNSKAKEVSAALTSINEKLSESAYNYYSLGQVAEASKEFEKAAKTVTNAPLSAIDTNSIYNAGFTAWAAGDNARAKGFFEQCASLGYLGEDGETYAKLADIAQKEGDTAKQKEWLETGFAAYPQSQSILIGLINYYVSSGEDTNRLFELIHEAQANEPNNPSLYYVEGNTQKDLGNVDEAIAAYEKCAEIDPNYVFGYIGEGILYYNQAIDFQEKGQNELDDAKYMEYVAQFETALKNCIPVFEKAFNITTDDDIKVSIAEYLKNANYRFREEDASYQQAYDKYNAIVEAGTAQ